MAHSRSKDPVTSHMAADAVEQTGAAGNHRDRCLAAVKARPGMTAAEIAVAAGLERHEASRRLPELRAAGLVYTGQARTCEVQGHSSLTWYPVAASITPPARQPDVYPEVKSPAAAKADLQPAGDTLFDAQEQPRKWW
jgi:hypothetical protein